MKICIDINDVVRAYTESFIKRFKKAFPTFGKTYYTKSENGWWEISETETDNEVSSYSDLPKNAKTGEIYVVHNKDFDIDDIEIKSMDYENVFPFKNYDEYQKFVYEDYAYEIFGCAESMERDLPVKFNRWLSQTLTDIETEEPIDVMFSSTKEYELTIIATYFFLSKNYRVREIYMPTDSSTIWDKCDVLITANPKLLLEKPEDKTVIKISAPYNENIQSEYEYDSLVDFMNDENNIIKTLMKNG